MLLGTVQTVKTAFDQRIVFLGTIQIVNSALDQRTVSAGYHSDSEQSIWSAYRVAGYRSDSDFLCRLPWLRTVSLFHPPESFVVNVLWLRFCIC